MQRNPSSADSLSRRAAQADASNVYVSGSNSVTIGGRLSSAEPRKRCRLCEKWGGLTVALENRPASLLKCKDCGVAFVDPLPDPVSITEHFRNEYITEDVHIEKIYGELRKGALGLVSSQVYRKKQSGKILDVGCAGGYFLDRYFDSSRWEKFGMEPSRYALRRAAARQITTFEGEVLSVELPAAFFDVITVAGVLPYFRDPKRELHILQRALKPGGLIVLELPLGATQIWRHTTPLGRITGGGWRSLLDSPHLFYYDAKSLRFLLSQSDFKLESLLSSPGNLQPRALHQFLYRSYFWMSNAVAAISAERCILGPGVIVSATHC